MTLVTGPSYDAFVLPDETPFLGRRTDLAAFTATRDAAAAGAARRVTIQGPPGIGKTRFLDEIVRDSTRAGWTVLRATGDPVDSVLPLAALARAIGGADTSAAAESGPERDVPLAGSVIGGNVAERRFRDEARIVDVLAALASNGPVLIAVDDVDLVDHSTRRVLDRLVDLLAGGPLLVVTTHTEPPTNEHDADSDADTGTLRIELDPLDGVDVAELVSAVLGRPRTELDEASSRALDEAGGVPLFVAAVLVEMGAGSSAARTADAEAACRARIRARIARLPDTSADALGTLAVLGRSAELDELLAMRPDDPFTVHRAIGEAADAGLVRLQGDRVTIRNALVADVLLEQMPLPVQRSVHGMAATLLADRHAPAARIAHHALRASGAHGGTMRRETVAWLLRGSREVGSRAPTVALDLLERAEELVEPDDPQRVDVLTETVAALGWTGEFERCERRARDVLAQPIDGARRAAMRRFLALCAFLQNRAIVAAEECEQSAAESDVPTLRARALGEAALARMAAADLATAHDRAVEAVEQSTGTGEPVSGCVGWSVRSRLRAFELDLDGSLAFAERAIEIARDDDTGEASLYSPGFFRLLTLVDLDRLDDAWSELERERTIGDRTGLAWAVPLHHGLGAVIHLFAGRLGEAETATRDGLRAVEAVGSGLASVWLHATAALVALHRGDTARARRHVVDGQHVAATQVPLLGVDLLALAEARVAEAEGDRHTARELVHGALQLFEAMGMANCSRLVAPDVVRLSMLTGRREMASEAGDVLASVASRTGAAIDVAQSTLAAAQLAGDPEQALAAVDAANGTGRLLQRATILDDAATVLWAAGCHDVAAELLSTALDLTDGLGARHDAARIRQRFADLGLRRPRVRRVAHGPDGLTHRESLVADLVSLGRTNNEVAEHLGISPRTVETHLTRIYAKLGMRSRTELAASNRPR